MSEQKRLPYFSRQELDIAVAAEREACAKIVEEMLAGETFADEIAAAIRARGTEDWQQRAAAAFAKDYKEGL